MVEFRIVTATAKDDFQTTATYKYYYNPGREHRRIYAYVIHEALKETQVTSHPHNSESCGNIAGLQVGLMKSPSIEELNFGRMFPFMHLYAENDKILEYPQNLDPEYTPEGITIINTKMTLILETKLGFAMTKEKKKKPMHLFLIPPMFLSQELMSAMAFKLKQLKDQDQGF